MPSHGPSLAEPSSLGLEDELSFGSDEDLIDTVGEVSLASPTTTSTSTVPPKKGKKAASAKPPHGTQDAPKLRFFGRKKAKPRDGDGLAGLVVIPELDGMVTPVPRPQSSKSSFLKMGRKKKDDSSSSSKRTPEGSIADTASTRSDETHTSTRRSSASHPTLPALTHIMPTLPSDDSHIPLTPMSSINTHSSVRSRTSGVSISTSTDDRPIKPSTHSEWLRMNGRELPDPHYPSNEKIPVIRSDAAHSMPSPHECQKQDPPSALQWPTPPVRGSTSPPIHQLASMTTLPPLKSPPPAHHLFAVLLPSFPTSFVSLSSITMLSAIVIKRSIATTTGSMRSVTSAHSSQQLRTIWTTQRLILTSFSFADNAEETRTIAHAHLFPMPSAGSRPGTGSTVTSGRPGTGSSVGSDTVEMDRQKIGASTLASSWEGEGEERRRRWVLRLVFGDSIWLCEMRSVDQLEEWIGLVSSLANKISIEQRQSTHRSLLEQSSKEPIIRAATRPSTAPSVPAGDSALRKPLRSIANPMDHSVNIRAGAPMTINDQDVAKLSVVTPSPPASAFFDNHSTRSTGLHRSRSFDATAGLRTIVPPAPMTPDFGMSERRRLAGRTHPSTTEMAHTLTSSSSALSLIGHFQSSPSSVDLSGPWGRQRLHSGPGVVGSISGVNDVSTPQIRLEQPIKESALESNVDEAIDDTPPMSTMHTPVALPHYPKIDFGSPVEMSGDTPRVIASYLNAQLPTPTSDESPEEYTHAEAKQRQETGPKVRPGVDISDETASIATSETGSRTGSTRLRRARGKPQVVDIMTEFGGTPSAAFDVDEEEAIMDYRPRVIRFAAA